MPVLSGMSIRMFPLTLEGDWTAALSEYGGACMFVCVCLCVCFFEVGEGAGGMVTDRVFPVQGLWQVMKCNAP